MSLVVIAALAGAEPQLLKTVKVPGNKTWTQTGLQLKKGQQLTITARGQVKSGSFTAGPAGATDVKVLADPEARNPMNSAPPLALIGRIGKGPPFVVGAQLVVTADRDGPPSAR